MFTFSGLRSGHSFQFENQILRCAPSAARTFTLVLTQLYTWSAHTENASLQVISEIWLLLQCATALQHTLYEADHALTQVRPSNFYSHILKKWSQMWPFWSQSRALPPVLTFFTPLPVCISDFTIRCHLLTLVNVLTNMNKQWTMHLLHYLLIFVNGSLWKYSCSMFIHVSSQCIN